MYNILSFLKHKSSRLISLLFALFIISGVIKAQTIISGTITDANDNTPLIGASVFVESLNIGGITDNNGKYSLQLHEGTHILLFSYIGYENIKKTITVKGKPINLNVSLKVNVAQLQEVVVTGKSEARQLREQAMPIAVITMNELQGTVSDVSDVLSKTTGV